MTDPTTTEDEEETCPECGGDVACDEFGNWTCIAVTDGMLGCGWTGDDSW